MLIKCSECGGAVSDKAPICPHCGAPPKESKTVPPPPKKRKVCPECKRPLGKTIVNEEEIADQTLPVSDFSEETEVYDPPRQSGFDFVAFFLRVMKFCFFLLTIFILAGSLLFFLIRYDIGGISSKLRTFAETDAGDGSHYDKSNSRVMFKFHLIGFLNALQGKEAKKTQTIPSPAPGKDPIENADKSGSVQTPDAQPKIKEERPPLNLPPPPPENAE